MTPGVCAKRDPRSPGLALPGDLTANQRHPAGLVTRRAAQRAEPAALDNPAGAATRRLVASATDHQRPDLSQNLTRDNRSCSPALRSG